MKMSVSRNFIEQEWRDMTFQCREYEHAVIENDFLIEKVTSEIPKKYDYENLCCISETG